LHGNVNYMMHSSARVWESQRTRVSCGDWVRGASWLKVPRATAGCPRPGTLASRRAARYNPATPFPARDCIEWLGSVILTVGLVVGFARTCACRMAPHWRLNSRHRVWHVGMGTDTASWGEHRHQQRHDVLGCRTGDVRIAPPSCGSCRQP